MKIYSSGNLLLYEGIRLLCEIIGFEYDLSSCIIIRYICKYIYSVKMPVINICRFIHNNFYSPWEMCSKNVS